MNSRSLISMAHTVTILSTTLLIAVLLLAEAGFAQQETPDPVYCGQCGFKNVGGATTCANCGAELTQPANSGQQPAADEDKLPPKPVVHSDSVYCGQCGAANPKGSTVCGNCGSPLPKTRPQYTIPDEKYCGACGAVNDLSSEYCSNCGALLPSVLTLANMGDESEAATSHAGGSQKLSFGGSFTSVAITRGDTTYYQNNAEGHVGYGFFVGNGWEIAGSAYGGTTWYKAEGVSLSSTDYYGGVDGSLKYYFVSSSRWVPFVGVKGGMSFTRAGTGSSGQSFGTFGGTAGFDIMLSEKASLFCAYLGSFGTSMKSGDDSETNSGSSFTNRFEFGMSLYF